MRVVPLAADSMGTRSMATLVETGGGTFLIDPGVDLGPKRYGLPPHPVEEERKTLHWQRIKEAAHKAQVLIITHYHHDHFNPRELGIFRGKLIILKDPEHCINRNQAKRARRLLKDLEGIPRGIMVGDDRNLEGEGVSLVFSPAVPHGASGHLGYVIQVAFLEGNETFLFTSDVQGPLLTSQQEFILDMDPSLLYCDGPMTYMLGVRYSKDNLEAALGNLIQVLESTRARWVILDHHLTRDLHYRKAIDPLLERAQALRKTVGSAAQYRGEVEDLLEAKRRNLYRGVTVQ